MPIIKRNYWDKPIPIRDEKCAYTESKQIGNKLYFGESLKNKLGKKAAIITFKVIPVIALSILFAPVAIPLFATFNVYRNTGRRIREVHYNRKFRFVDAYIKSNNINKSRDTSSPVLPKEVLKLVCQKEVENLHGRKALKYLESLRLVSKEAKSISDELRIELINSGNIILSDLPEINVKQDVIDYVEAHKNSLRTLNLLDSFDWEDADIHAILLACPNLERLSVSFDKMTSAAYDDVTQFKNLKHLSIKRSPFPLDFDALKQLAHLKTIHLEKVGVEDADITTLLASHPHLESLSITEEKNITNSALEDIAQFQDLRYLELGRCNQLTDLSSISNLPELHTLRLSDFIPKELDNLPKLRHLSLVLWRDFQGKLPNLNHFTELESLNIFTDCQDIPPLNALVNLKELTLQGHSIRQIPSLDNLGQLRELSISSARNLQFIPSLDKLTNLEKFEAKSLEGLNAIPLLPDKLKKLSIQDCSNLALPGINHLFGLEQLELILNNFILPTNYFDSLTQLKKLYFKDYDPQPNFPSLDALTNLQVLRLPSLYKLPSLIALKNLKGLEIHGNLPDLNDSHKLEFLVMSFCKYKNHQLKGLKNLKVLDCSGHLCKNLFQDLENLQTLSILTNTGVLPHLNNQPKLNKIYLGKDVAYDPAQLENCASLKKIITRPLYRWEHNGMFDELVD